ncbi:MAG TPA: response regulator [Bacteroidota bacterium]|nr:response regulator [Bacteroidota bacterium]
MSDRILVVDDEDSLRLTTKMRLQAAGFEVDDAADGEAALEKMKEQPFDVALLDIKMPKLDGIETLALILQTYPQTEVIMMTGFSDFASAVECLKAGAKDYLVKPIEATELITRIRSLLRTRASEKALAQVQHHYSSMLFYDLFGPLRTIGDVVDKALRSSPSSDEQKDLLTYARDLTTQISKKIRKTFDYSTIENTNLELTLSKAQLDQMVLRVAKRIEVFARDRKLSVKTSVEGNTPGVQCDADKVEQVVISILFSLIMHSQEGATIEVAVSRSSKQADRHSKEYVQVSAFSNLSRIHEEELDMLFHKNGHPSSKSVGDVMETILNLAIAKRIIEAHRGLFWVGPKSGSGIRFNLMLPL